MPTSGRISSCCSSGRRPRDRYSAADGNDYDESATTTTTTTTSRVVCGNALLQIQDFNRGRYPTHSFVEDDNDDDDNTTCLSGMRDVRRG